jgi:hypothetical protein
MIKGETSEKPHKTRYAKRNSKNKTRARRHGGSANFKGPSAVERAQIEASIAKVEAEAYALPQGNARRTMKESQVKIWRQSLKFINSQGPPSFFR